MSFKEQIEELEKSIYNDNISEGKEIIPSSDTIIRIFRSFSAQPPEIIKKMLQTLVEANHIFQFELVKAEATLFIEPIYGYVVCDKAIITKAKKNISKRLEASYHARYSKTKWADSIINELISEIHNLNNTPLGRFLNEYISLGNFEKLIVSEAASFTPTVKRQKFNLAYNKFFGFTEEQDTGEAVSVSSVANQTSRRAVDDPGYRNYSSAKDTHGNKKNWSNSVQKFTVPFLLRIHFRKYEFSYVRQLIKKGRISKAEDLKMVLTMLSAVENNYNVDVNLNNFKKDILDLKYLVHSVLAKKKKTEL